jgi:hypothetical protein
MLVYAYRLVKGDRISGVPADVTDVKNRNADLVKVYFANGHETEYPFDKFLNVSHRAGVARPRYRPEHRGN